MYHYTSAQGLFGVVTDGMLRASEASSLNDLAEVRLGWKTIGAWLSRQSKSEAVLYLRRRTKSSRLEPRHQVFVCSGTTAPDDANQWRLYAEQGRGYAIEIDGSVPMGVVSRNALSGRGDSFAAARVTEIFDLVPWHHVLYTTSDQKKALSALLHYTEEELREISQIDDDEGQEHAYEVLDQEVGEELATIAHLIKGPGFVGEREVRVVARFMWFGRHVGYRAGAYGVAGHVFIVHTDREGQLRSVTPPPDMGSASASGFVHPLALTGVRLGPLLHRGNKDTVRAFLRSHGLTSTKVRVSKVPLR